MPVCVCLLKALKSWHAQLLCLWLSITWPRKEVPLLSFSAHGAHLPLEQLLTYWPTARGFWISDVSQVLSLILKGPSRSLPLQDLKQVRASAKGLFFWIQKFKNTKPTLQLRKCTFSYKITSIKMATKAPGHCHCCVVSSPIMKFKDRHQLTCTRLSIFPCHFHQWVRHPSI